MFLQLCLVYMCTQGVLGTDEISIVDTSEEYTLVEEGGVANLSCTTDQEWFFCLWRHPSGVKECIVSENGTYTSSCAGMEHLEIQGSGKTCSLLVYNVSSHDHGGYMCLFNQAEIFHTARTEIQVGVMTRGRTGLVRTLGDRLEMVEGEMVQLECEGRGAYPAVEFEWEYPGIHTVRDNMTTEYGSHTIHSWSSINYTASLSDNGCTIQCVAIQEYNGVILYRQYHNITLYITQPLSLRSDQVESIGTWAGACLAIILAIIILAIMVIKMIKNNKHTAVGDQKKDDRLAIWTTKTLKRDSSVLASNLSISSYPSNIYKPESNPECKAEVHNSSSSCSSSRTPVSSDTSFETNRSLSEIHQRDTAPCGPVYMYNKTTPPHTEDKPIKLYQPQRLGHFDPSRDVCTGASLEYREDILSPGIYPVPHSITVRQAHNTKIEERESRLQSWEDASIGGASTISVFDCHHGCFSPHNDCDHTLVDNLATDNLYLEESHCSPTGHRYTVKTRDVQL